MFHVIKPVCSATQSGFDVEELKGFLNPLNESAQNIVTFDDIYGT